MTNRRPRPIVLAQSEAGVLRTPGRDRTRYADDGTLDYIRELEEANTQLKAEVEAAELAIQAANAVNEQRRVENEQLRRTLVALLPPDVVYQEARALARRLRGGG